jgi:hypothetical protein
VNFDILLRFGTMTSEKYFGLSPYRAAFIIGATTNLTEGSFLPRLSDIGQPTNKAQLNGTGVEH